MVLVPCGLADRYQCFGEAYCLHIQSRSDNALSKWEIMCPQYMLLHLFAVFLFYQWFCVLSFIQIVKELELVHKMGHYEKGKLNFHKYQRMNVLELGAERYPMSEDFVPVADFSRHYNKKSINENIRSRFSIDSDYINVMARPVY